MPYGKTYRKPKKYFKKYKKSYRQNTQAIRKPLPYVLPTTYMCRLKYAQTLTMDAQAAVIATNNFVANGLYDVDSTGIGHQPRGFDQLMANYLKYTVMSSKIRMMPICVGTVAPCAYGIVLSDEGTTISSTCTTLDDLNELEDNTRCRQTGILQMINTEYKGVTKYFSLKKWFGINKGETRDDIYSGTASANPTEKVYFECWSSGMNGNNPDAIGFSFVIEFIVLFSGLKQVSSS